MIVYAVSVRTDIAGSLVKTTVFLEDDTSPEDIAAVCKEAAFEMLDWHYEEISRYESENLT